MSEIYWITRLDAINIVIGTFAFISAIITLFFLVGFSMSGFKISDEKDGFTKNDFKTLKRFFILTVILLSAFVFIPSRKDMLLIYGVGGTIDYLKTNEIAKQLPDKCIQALDQLIDEYIPKEDETE